MSRPEASSPAEPFSSRGPSPCLNRLPFFRLVSRPWGASRSRAVGGAAVVCGFAVDGLDVPPLGPAPGALVPQDPSAPSVTQTCSALDRMDFGRVALKAWSPRASYGPTVAAPSAPVVLPSTVAPATGAPVPWSMTLTPTAWPGLAVAGPVSLRI